MPKKLVSKSPKYKKPKARLLPIKKGKKTQVKSKKATESNAERSKKRLAKLVDTSNKGFLSTKEKAEAFLKTGPGTRKRIYDARAGKTTGKKSAEYKRSAAEERKHQAKLEKAKKRGK